MPDHYSKLDPQPITVIESWGLGFHLGNAIKYLARATHKGDEVRDLAKAQWYIKRHLQLLEAQRKGVSPPAPDPQV